MISMIRQGINLYKKANKIENTQRSDYPALILNLFGVTLSSSELDSLNANELMDILIKKGV